MTYNKWRPLMKLRKQRVMLLLCCLVIGLSGCAAVIAAGVGAGVGFGTYKYVESNLKRDYIGPPGNNLGSDFDSNGRFAGGIGSEGERLFWGTYQGIMHDGTNITIKMKRLTDNSTEVGVRVGVFGDRKKSEFIHDKMAEKFKTT
jgi:hypothetical protein